MNPLNRFNAGAGVTCIDESHPEHAHGGRVTGTDPETGLVAVVWDRTAAPDALHPDQLRVER